MLRNLKKHPRYKKKSIFSQLQTYLFTGLIIFSLGSASGYSHADSMRIVAIDGSLTEIIFALGEGRHLVGRDITSNYPDAALELPSVGYMRSLSAEGILSLRPNIIIATTDARPQAVLKRLKDIGVRVELIENRYSAEGVKYKIRRVAAIINKEKEGEKLVERLQISVDRAMETAKHAMQQHGKVSGLFILNMRGGNMMVAGSNNRANSMLEMAQIHNPAAEHFKIFKPLTAEAAVKFNPQFIITMPHGVSAAGGKDSMLKSPALSLTDAGRQGNLVVMENGFLTFGPRLGEAIENLVNAVYK